MLNIEIEEYDIKYLIKDIEKIKDESVYILNKAFDYLFNINLSTVKNIFDKDCYIDLVIIDNETITNINNEYRNLNEATNVISLQFFSTQELENSNYNIIKLGSIAISVEYAINEAKQENIDFHDHYTRLLIHGFLHCLGFEHESESDAKNMESLENQILNSLNIQASSIVAEYWK